ncbi:MAG: nuclear transport factor 2 family protein [Novosphingobium sp.]|nr:nuclear transport factor 2 family protein [Novosphingobium sp.]
MSEAALLRELADKQAITEQIYRYCRAVDRLDIPLGHSVFHEDSFADYGADFYQGPGRGVIDLICQSHLGLTHHSHQVSNILITLDGDRAGSESYVTGTMRLKRGEAIVQLAVWGRYIDSWSRRDGAWGIDRRFTMMEFDESREVKPTGRPLRSGRGPDDPSYAVLG